MAALQGIGAALLLAAAALGGGHALLALLRVPVEHEVERDPVAAAIGVGLLGWLVFFLGIAGHLERPTLLVLAVCLLPGLALRPRARPRLGGRPDAWMLALLALVAIVLALDLAEGFSPPADADTLAYHFELPREFLREGRIVFVPRAVDGAIPLLLHMTYLAALGIGGVTGLTLWAMLLGWLPSWLLFAYARRWLDARWSLALAALFLTTPAVVFGGGSGQLETKLAAWALVAAVAVADARRTGDARYAALAGLAAGCYVGAKLIGVVVAGACGLALLPQRRWLRHAALFSLAVLVAGWQWYWWIWLHTGDPVFPMLYDGAGAPPGYWSAALGDYFRAEQFGEENPAPRNLLRLIAYPFVATLAGYPNWDAGRTGFGPFGLVMLPWALAGLVLFRKRIASSPLATIALVCLATYVVWYLAGISQRVRHVLPVYPLLLLCLAVAAERLARRRPALAAPIGAAVAAVLALQLAGAGVFGLNYLRHLATGESRAAFLERNVARFGPVPWINAHLPGDSRLLITERQIRFYLDVPSFGAYPRFQHQLDLLPGSSTPSRFWAELRALGVTHILLAPSLADYRAGVRHIWTDDLGRLTLALADAGCAHVVHSEMMRAPRSRTLPSWDANEVSSDVVALAPECRLPE